jgi:hypothetical protein
MIIQLSIRHRGLVDSFLEIKVISQASREDFNLERTSKNQRGVLPCAKTSVLACNDQGGFSFATTGSRGSPPMEGNFWK